MLAIYQALRGGQRLCLDFFSNRFFTAKNGFPALRYPRFRVDDNGRRALHVGPQTSLSALLPIPPGVRVDAPRVRL